MGDEAHRALHRQVRAAPAAWRGRHPGPGARAVAAYQARLGLPPRAAVARRWRAGLAGRFQPPPGPRPARRDPLGHARLPGRHRRGGAASSLPSGPDSPTSLGFVPDHHLVVLHCSQILRHFEDVWPLVRALPGGMPRTSTSSPARRAPATWSSTPAAGRPRPRSVHVILVDALM